MKTCPSCDTAFLGFDGLCPACTRRAERIVPEREQPVKQTDAPPVKQDVSNNEPVKQESSTYRYRDPDKHRAYMREYMRRRRVT